jgi:hypothetical protein
MSFITVKSISRKAGDPCPICHSHDNRAVKGNFVQHKKSLKCPVCGYLVRPSRQKPIRYARIRKIGRKEFANLSDDTKLLDALAVLKKM